MEVTHHRNPLASAFRLAFLFSVGWLAMLHAASASIQVNNADNPVIVVNNATATLNVLTPAASNVPLTHTSNGLYRNTNAYSGGITFDLWVTHPTLRVASRVVDAGGPLGETSAPYSATNVPIFSTFELRAPAIVSSVTTAVTSEGGSSLNLTVRLRASPEPGQTVVVTATSGNPAEGIVTAGATLTFAGWPNLDWRNGLTVTLTPQDDTAVPPTSNPADGDITYALTLAINTAATTDALYDGVAAQIVTITNQDNDKPLDAVLVLDRSGSMNGSSGVTTKIQALANAGALFTDLLAPLTATAPTPNRLGAVAYNSTTSTLLPLGVLNFDPASGHHQAALDKFNAAAIADPARLKPQGMTAIGAGMLAGRNLMAVSSADPNFNTRQRLLVVMSDGNENSGISVHDVLTTAPTNALFSTADGTKRYSIGFGSDFTPAVLQEITNVVGSATDFSGYQHVEDSTTTAGVALSAVYFKIFADAQGIAMPVDPTFLIPLIGDTQPIEVGRVRLTSLDYRADLVILDEPIFRPWYTLELIDPKGRVVDASSTFGGNPVHLIRNANYALYRLVLPAPAINSDHLGDWVIRLTPIKQPGGEATHAGAAATRRPERVPIGFAAATRSDFHLDFTAVPGARTPTTDIHLSARLLAHGVPTRGGNVRVRITPPGSPMQDLDLHDDGQGGDPRAHDGIHTAIFPRAARDGVYRFDARAVGHSGSGEQIPRELTRFVYLAPLADVVTPAGPTTGPRDPCCPAFWVGVAVLAVIALLLLILVLRRR